MAVNVRSLLASAYGTVDAAATITQTQSSDHKPMYVVTMAREIHVIRSVAPGSERERASGVWATATYHIYTTDGTLLSHHAVDLDGDGTCDGWVYRDADVHGGGRYAYSTHTLIEYEARVLGEALRYAATTGA